MAYIGTVTLHDKEGKALHTLRYGRMPKGAVDEMCEGLQNDVQRLLKLRPDLNVATLADGAPEMRNLLTGVINKDTTGKDVTDLVDFWHLMEKLGKAAEAMYDTKETRAAALARWKLLLLNKSDAAARILAEFTKSGMEDRRVGDTKPIHDAITYIQNNQDRMDYASARARGLPIGSGNTEATCKSLAEIRLKRSGARWKEESGEHVVQLRALALSDRWLGGVVEALKPLKVTVEVAA